MGRRRDRSERQKHLVDLAFKVIAQEGLEAATVRRLAQEAGCSTKVVTHHYPNKRILMFDVYEHCAVLAENRLALALLPDPEDVCAAMEALLPIGEEARMGWRVNFAFWDLAIYDDLFGKSQLYWTRNAERLMRDILGTNPSWTGDTEWTARHLVTLIQGIAVRASFDDSWTDAVQRDFLAKSVAPHGIPTAARA